MSVIRVKRNNRERFLITDAEIHERTDLSWEARGLHAYLMLKPDDWTIKVPQLMKAGPAGRDKLRRMLRELEAAGYLNRRKINDPNTGQLVMIHDVYENVGLNPEKTPIYGGGNGHGENGVTDDGFSGDGLPDDGLPDAGKHGHLTKIDLTNKYKGDFSHFESTVTCSSGNGLDHQQIQEMVTALSGVCKGFANLAMPEQCDFHARAITLIQAGRTVTQVKAFGPWWERNRLYEGQPALKSLMDDLDNSINGVERTKKRGNGMDRGERQAVKEIGEWIARQRPASDFTSPHTLAALRAVGESELRGMNDYTRGQLMSTFRAEYRRAKQNGAKA